ncbi:hypothetical protein Vadar_005295 [Vaccinium darrowii]|uniref:Uncharacterized protein n=1 Tax=Vaccinium darrowii TaxID=229202 RepID=A0ACB7YKI2_9ERIC|nr:hypothetical protein Vadar_005295 [Vaccinium darrowii]
MEKSNSTPSGLLRTKSDQLVETVMVAIKSLAVSSDAFGGADTTTGRTLSRKSSKRLASPGWSGGNTSKNKHIRKSRSAQMKLDIDEASSGAALSRASSASLGFSFSFTGFSVPPDDIVDMRPFNDDVIQVTYKVILKGMTSTVEKDIQNGISGSVNPGEVLALMGPSGSGKTTLLSLLGGRLREPAPGGLVTYNDQLYSKFLKSRIGFVTQDDVLFPHLTVKETLTYAALLRLPKTLAKEEKEKRAINVICELGLERCQDTMIGGSFVRGVSGGERKRVCIGNEIIINPSLLFLDEPTSGLDSTTALRIVEILQDIAEAGKTVITTIHQPSSRLFHKFDKLILLGKGSLLYFGKVSEAMVYFSSIGCSPLIAMNPAEFLLDLANGNMNDVSIPSELEDKVQMGNSDTETRNGKPSPAVVHEYLVEAYETRVADNEKKKLIVPLPIGEELKSKMYTAKREWEASWWEQFSILFWRGLKERRHDYFSWLRITKVLTTAVIVGLLWWQSDNDSPKDLQDQGFFSSLQSSGVFFPVFNAIFTFPQERAMLNKEQAANMYRMSAYFVARTSSDLPLDLLLPVLFLVVVYFMAGLEKSAGTFFLTIVTVFLCIVAAQNVPVFISWLRYLSFNYDTYRLLLKVHYENITHSVDGVKIDSGLTAVCALLAMVVGYRLLAYISLRRMKLQPGS